MKAARHICICFLLSLCLRLFGADPVELRLWPGKAPGSENWKVPESVTNRGGNRVVMNVSDPTLTVFLGDAVKSNGAAIIIAPGGALQALSLDSEGTRVVEQQGHRGFRAEVSAPPTTSGLRQRRRTSAPWRHASTGVDDRQGKRESGARRRPA
jgi:hypothetical protein